MRGQPRLEEPIFEPSFLKPIEWTNHRGKVLLIYLSNQLHCLLRTFVPHAISTHTGPYDYDRIMALISQYLHSKTELLSKCPTHLTYHIGRCGLGKALGGSWVTPAELLRHIKRHCCPVMVINDPSLTLSLAYMIRYIAIDNIMTFVGH